ncbi:hypothetical protein, partial [Bacteroides heparinolyticus]|uniref:hypothetical protein n=1 Tax=Prevotella heparinolytica TaxID=28113 RepID=UPI00359F45C1
MTKESKRRKKKGRKGRKGKGHIIIYTCAQERGKGRLKDGSHAGGGRNTERRRDTETIRGKARGKKGEGAEGKRTHNTTCAHFILQKTEEERPADD